MRLLGRLLPVFLLAASVVPGGASVLPEQVGARVIVSSTLNDSLLILDAATLEPLQPALPSKGPGPVRLWVQRIGGRDLLFSANHGAPAGSVGVFDLSGDLVTELPLSPFPARAGTVGITGGLYRGDPLTPVIAATNTQFALGGCGMPTGSVTVYDATALAVGGVLREVLTADTSGSLPYAVGMDDNGIFVTNNCSGTLDRFAPLEPRLCEPGIACHATYQARATTPAGAGADGVAVHEGALWVANISGNSVDRFMTGNLADRVTVPLSGTRPIEVAVGETPNRRWVFTANDGDDSVSVLDRDVIATCTASCPQAEVARIPTGVAGGDPESVAFDPLTRRIFVVNKSGAVSLSVIQIDDPVTGPPSVEMTRTIPLGALVAGDATIPALIAFDVVVAR